MAKEDHYSFDGDDGLSSAKSSDGPEETQTQVATPTPEARQTPFDGGDIPLIFRRQGNGVKYLRETAKTMYMLDQTAEDLTAMVREMEDHFTSDEVQKLDVYEAVVMNGLRQNDDLDTDGVSDVLEEFGYGLGE